MWLSGLSASLQPKGSLVQFPVRPHAWVAGQVPSGELMRGNHTLMIPALSFSCPSPLSKNKINKILKRKKECTIDPSTLRTNYTFVKLNWPTLYLEGLVLNYSLCYLVLFEGPYFREHDLWIMNSWFLCIFHIYYYINGILQTTRIFQILSSSAINFNNFALTKLDINFICRILRFSKVGGNIIRFY